MNYQEEYQRLYQKELKKNIGFVLGDLNKPYLKTKIENWAKKFDYPLEEVKREIRDNEMFRRIFAKDPMKQSFHQKEAEKFIRELKLVTNFPDSLDSDKQSLYLGKDKIFDGKNKSAQTESIDFQWESNGFVVYASHQYTQWLGGSQNKKYREIENFLENANNFNKKGIENFLENANNFNKKGIVFIAICDGDYYSELDGQYTKKLCALCKSAKPPKSYAVNMEGLKGVLESLK
jgi:hypothetical protein